jgi:hypothetical protein
VLTLNMERPILQTPQNASEFVQQSWPDTFFPAERHIVTYPEIKRKKAEPLLKYVSEDLSASEEDLYFDFPDIESKLAFLGGSPFWDISQLETWEGKTIYRDPPPFMKNSEIHEFVVVANLVTNDHAPVVDFASEAADVFYNLVRCMSLDNYDDPPDYINIIDDLAGDLGWSRRQALLLAAAKFHRRFVETKRKDPEGERTVIEGLFVVDRFVKDARPYIPVPSMTNINNAARALLHHQEVRLIPRYKDIRYKKQMGKSKYQKPELRFGK